MKNATIFQRAKNCLAQYESEDFKNEYTFSLIEDTHAVTYNIMQVLQRKNNYPLARKAAEIVEHIFENYENNILEFSGYHVGDTCISSVAFGEQHVCFESLQIPKNKWKQAAVIFDSLGFVVNDGNAFYIVDGGIKIDLDSFIDLDADTIIMFNF